MVVYIVERRLVNGRQWHSEKEMFDVVRMLRRFGVLVWAYLVAFWCLIGWGLYYLAGM